MDICVRKLIGADSQNVCVIPTSCPPMPDSSRLNKQKKATVHCKVCGVLQFLFLFLFSSFYQIDSHHETCVAFCKSAMKHPQKSDWKSGFLWFSYGYRKCMFVDWIHKFSPSCLLLSVEFEYVWSLNVCLYGLCFWILTLQPHTNYIYVFQYRKKVIEWHPQTLDLIWDTTPHLLLGVGWDCKLSHPISNNESWRLLI